ncbi:MAG: 50S ribosome-binding GTPase [Tissierellia bacterium]|nr:50S ribosome-binding GTPase [Tissierellia bacterium]
MKYDEVYEKWKNEGEKLEELRIMVAGKSGAGKTTLIKEVFGDLEADEAPEGIGLPVTDTIRDYRSKNSPLILTDTVGFTTLEDNKESVKALRTRFQSKTKRPHLLWYVVNSGTNRLEEREVAFIEMAVKYAPVLLVISQSIGINAEILEQKIREMNLPIEGIHPLLARKYYLRGGGEVEAFGVKELIHKSYDILDTKVQESFAAAQVHDVDLKVKAARAWAKGYIAATFGVGFIPIPFSDAGILVPLQATMILHIAHIFGMKAEKAKIGTFLSAGLLPEGAKMAGRALTGNLLKWIPGIGSLTGGLIQGSTAAAITWTMVESYIQVLKRTYLRGGREMNEEIWKETLEQMKKQKEIGEEK